MFMQVGFCGRDQAIEDAGFVLFSFFNVLWACIYVEAWKRYSAELAYRWGTLDQRDELLVEPRPLFTVSTTGSITMLLPHVLCKS
jgi:anoctamin-8